MELVHAGGKEASSVFHDRPAPRGRSVAWLLLALAVELAPFPAFAKQFTVNQLSEGNDANPGDGICATSGGFCTLRAAVAEANASAEADEITFSADGTYAVSAGALSVAGELTVTAANPKLAVILDAANMNRVFEVLAGAKLTLQHVTVQNGKAASNANDPCSGQGGAICVLSQGTVVVDDSTVTKSTAPNGGGIASVQGSVQLTSAAIVSENTASAGDGGGVVSRGGSLMVNNSTVRANKASGFGGGLGLSNGASLTILGSTLTANEATGSGSGGGISAFDAANVTIANSTFNANKTASGAGGGLFFGGTLAGQARLNNVTVSANTAGAALGGGIVANVPAPGVELANTILANNTTPDCVGAVVLGANDLVAAPGSCTTGAGDVVGDPKLLSLQDNGGSTLTQSLPQDSPAVDGGSGLAVGAGFPACEGTDQRGIPRPQLVRCDIGAVELPPDRDRDGIPDPFDNCPDDRNPDQTDTDGDTIGDKCDNCPNVKAEADDVDADGVPGDRDCCLKTALDELFRGCGVNDNGCSLRDACGCETKACTATAECPCAAQIPLKNRSQWLRCAKNFRKSVHGKCAIKDVGAACGRRTRTADDVDGDGVPNDRDNCPRNFNPRQCDFSGNGTGNPCDNDIDGDGVPNAVDHCPRDSDETNADKDGDKIGDVCDNCPDVQNADQANADGDAFGDACDRCRNLATASNEDADKDGIGDDCDCCSESNKETGGFVDCDGCNASDSCDCQKDKPPSCQDERPCNHGACHGNFQPRRTRACKPR